jgi:hypothetical protein
MLQDIPTYEMAFVYLAQTVAFAFILGPIGFLVLSAFVNLVHSLFQKMGRAIRE